MSVSVCEQLPLLATAPNGINKLRELILELAVRGKLVAQNAGDEPASALLKRIAVERKRKGFARSSADADEAPQFDLPTGWEWVRFGEIAQHNAGKALDRGRNHGVLRDYITTSNLYWGRFALDNVRQMAIHDEEVERCTARKGDLLICEGGEAGRAAVWDEDREICFQNHIHRTRFYGCISAHFAYRVFERLNATGEINRFRKGVGISNMSGKALASVPFPLPSLAEQHRIVAKIDELMALCDRLETQQDDAESAHAQLVATLLDSLTRARDSDDFAASWQRLSAHFHTLFTTESSTDALKQALLQLAVMGKLVPQDPDDEPVSELLKRIVAEKTRLEAVGEIRKQKPLSDFSEEEQPSELPEGWAWLKLGAIGVAATGRTPSTNNLEFYGGDLPLIGPGQISNEGKIRDPEKWLTESAMDETALAEQGDILMVCIGGSIGKCAIADRKMAFNQQINSVRALFGDSRYVLAAVSESGFQSMVRLAATGSATPIINRSKWEGLPIPVPPESEQRRIIAKVDQLMALCDQLKSHLIQARQLNEQLANVLVQRAVA